MDVYYISQAVEDGATVRIYYESRLTKVRLSKEGKKLVSDLDDTLDPGELTETQKEKTKWTQLETLIGSPSQVKQIAQDMIYHFEHRQEVFKGKAMIVAISRRIAADLYKEIINIHPNWHDKDLKKGAIKVVMTAASSDGPEDELKLVIVRDMRLTHFAIPFLHTLYINKPMKDHNLSRP